MITTILLGSKIVAEFRNDTGDSFWQTTHGTGIKFIMFNLFLNFAQDSSTDPTKSQSELISHYLPPCKRTSPVDDAPDPSHVDVLQSALWLQACWGISPQQPIMSKKLSCLLFVSSNGTEIEVFHSFRAPGEPFRFENVEEREAERR